MSETSAATVEYAVREGVAWLTLQRPEKLNALAGDMRERLRDHIRDAAADDAVRAIVLTGSGRAFCAGGDIEHMIGLQSAGDEEGFRRLLHVGAEVVLGLQAFPGLTVAAVNGVAAGAGLSLALACDVRIAAPTARFAAPWIKLGLVPDWAASFWLPRLIGAGRALEMVVSGEPVDATEALRVGLVTRIEDAADFAAAVQDRVARLAAAGLAVAHAKRLVRAGAEDPLEAALAREADAQEQCFESEDFAEGLAAFREKRPPRFRGR